MNEAERVACSVAVIEQFSWFFTVEDLIRARQAEAIRKAALTPTTTSATAPTISATSQLREPENKLTEHKPIITTHSFTNRGFCMNCGWSRDWLSRNYRPCHLPKRKEINA